MFKVSHLISKFTLLKDLTFWLNQLHVNHKSNISQFIIIMYHTIKVPFQVRHKLYYFHFCQNFQKKTTLNVETFENSIKEAKFEPTTSLTKN
jgi:hypothetical protein